MANPQIENGYVPLANEVVEALARTPFNGYEIRYLFALWRKTYGWHKKDDTISNSQFVVDTGLKKQHIWRTEKRLVERGIVTKNGYKISFNKDYTQWKQYPKMVTVTKLGIKVTKSGTKVTKYGAHKRNFSKETIQKKEDTALSADAPLIPVFIDLFKKINPTYRFMFGSPPQRRAAERLLKLRTVEDWTKVIDFIGDRRSDRFCPRITTAIQLEQKYGDLETYAQGLKGQVKSNNLAF